MQPPTIKSRPLYGSLAPQPGNAHLIVADRDGIEAVRDMARATPAGFFGDATIIVVGCDDGLQALAPLGASALVSAPGLAHALEVLNSEVDRARMGLRVYLAGSEGLIGQATALLLERGVEAGAIADEHRGSRARRVQCVHCKAFTDDVTTQPAACSGCGLMLFVRDHYSRRLAAFQGVCIDAEEPGSAPAPQEAFA